MGSEEFDEKRKRNESGDSCVSNDSYSNYIPTPPDGGWGWVVVFASFINHVIVDGITFTFGVFYIEFLEEYEESKGKTALVGSLLAGFYLMAGPVASALVNRYGCRVVCIAGSMISSTAFVLATLSPNITVLMLTYGCMGGFGFGLIYLPSVIIVSYYFEKKRALATGIAVCGAGVGGFIFAPVGRIMLEALNWKNGLYVVAGIVLNGIVCGMLMRPLEPPKKKIREKNLFDRLREKAFGPGRRNRACSGISADFGGIAQGLQEAKLAREQRLCDEDDESELGSLPNSRFNSMKRLDGKNSRSPSVVNSLCQQGSNPPSQLTSRQNSIQNGAIPQLPAIIINAEDDLREDIANDVDDHEKANMLKRDSDSGIDSNNSSKSSKTKLVYERKNSKGGAALPRHMRREMSGGLPAVFNKNSSLPNVPNVAFMESATEEQNGKLKPFDEEMSKCLSVGNVLVLSPRRKRKPLPDGVEKSDLARPLYRRDIFYSGSVLHIPQFRSQPDVGRYAASITTIPGNVAPEKESKIWGCLPIPKTAKDILKQMLDLSMLKNPVFLIACLGEIFGFVGLFIPFVYVAERAIVMGIPATHASFLLSVIGITNTIGRILSGFLADLKWVDSLLLHNVMMIVGGLACILNTFATTYPLMIAFSAVFGLSVAAYISLTSIILCNLMGLEKLTSAFGFLTMVRGFASIAGPPVAGMVFDATGDYDMSFHVGGVMFIMAGLMYCILHLPHFSRKRKLMEEAAMSSNVQQVFVTPPDESTMPEETEKLKLENDEYGNEVDLIKKEVNFTEINLTEEKVPNGTADHSNV
jgi:MFS family permease